MADFNKKNARIVPPYFLSLSNEVDLSFSGIADKTDQELTQGLIAVVKELKTLNWFIGELKEALRVSEGQRSSMQEIISRLRIKLEFPESLVIPNESLLVEFGESKSSISIKDIDLIQDSISIHDIKGGSNG